MEWLFGSPTIDVMSDEFMEQSDFMFGAKPATVYSGLVPRGQELERSTTVFSGANGVVAGVIKSIVSDPESKRVRRAFAGKAFVVFSNATPINFLVELCPRNSEELDWMVEKFSEHHGTSSNNSNVFPARVYLPTTDKDLAALKLTGITPYGQPR